MLTTADFKGVYGYNFEEVPIHVQFLGYPMLPIFERAGEYGMPVSVAEAKNQVLTDKVPKDTTLSAIAIISSPEWLSKEYPSRGGLTIHPTSSD